MTPHIWRNILILKFISFHVHKRFEAFSVNGSLIDAEYVHNGLTIKIFLKPSLFGVKFSISKIGFLSVKKRSKLNISRLNFKTSEFRKR